MIPTCLDGSFYWEHVCFKDQNVEYVNPRFGSCYPDRFFVGIEKSVFPDTHIKLYPNPCGDILNFDFAPPSSGSGFVVRIYDMTGKLVLKKEAASTPLEISQLSLGMYVLDIETGFGNQKFRFIKAEDHFQE
ncbi:MAG: T9SS type A sorting domain-containing protein [Bacteroidales bacterium]|nr:T9SS type A sorting domain-containing protein [Bacteroidales bacterium]